MPGPLPGRPILQHGAHRVSVIASTTDSLSLAVEHWLFRHVPGYEGPGVLSKFGFGQSNPTFLLTAASGSYVLRRKPMGTLLPKAHAIDREFRVLRGLADTEVPVPRVHAYCEDSTLLGAPFYVMEFVEGRIFHDQTLPGLSAQERASVFDGMNSTIAKLHRVEPSAVGLSTYGRTEGFLPRQIALWTQQYRASEGASIPAMEKLIDWLPRNVPHEQTARIFHGDLRLDNFVFHPTEPRVIALLDWELSTLGDPIADFAYCAMVWRIAPSLFRGLLGLPLTVLGIPDETDYVHRYCERVGRDELPAWNFYLTFGLFRVASILQGVWRRALDGNASAADAADVGARAAPLAEIALAIAANNDHP